MKIENRLRNIFDQYIVEENRVTNSLLHLLANDETFLKKFFSEFLKINNLGNKSRLVIESQKKVGEAEKNIDKNESTPDGLITIDDEIGIVFESKIKPGAINFIQLRRHVHQILHYDKKYLCVITPDIENPIQNISFPNTKIKWIPWRAIYDLLNKEKTITGLEGDIQDQSKSQYLKNQLKGFLSMKDNLVGFQGIDFNPETFDRDKAKIVLKSLIKEIKPDIIKIYPKFNIEKSNYTTEIHPYKVSAGGVWSYLAADKNFTNDIHMTFWLTETHMGMGLTTPNNAGARWKRLKDISENDNYFNEFIVNLLRLRKKVPNLYLEFLQRHYIGRKFGVVDGIFEMNLDTFKGGNNIKVNELWLKSLRNMIINKKGFNGQLMLRTRYFYIKDKNIKKAAFKDEVIRAAEMFKEIYDYLMK